MNERAYHIPKDIDAPIPFFAWEVRDAVIGAAGLTMGIIFHQFWGGVLLFALWMYFAKKAAAGAKRGQMAHALYAKGFTLDPAMQKFAPPPKRIEFL